MHKIFVTTVSMACPCHIHAVCGHHTLMYAHNNENVKAAFYLDTNK